MKNNYFDLYTTITLSEDVAYKNLNEYLSKKINYVLLLDNKLKEIHEKRNIKGYVFSSLHPIEKDKVYKSGKTYIFNIYVVDFDFALRLRDALKQSDYFDSVNMRIKEFKPVDELYSTTPCLTTLKNSRYWTLNDSISLLYEAIDKNTKRKANELYGISREKLDCVDNFIESISLRNNQDVIFNYKNSKLVTYTVAIKVKKDPISQLLANICISCGIGEKNSLGFGFCRDGGKDK